MKKKVNLLELRPTQFAIGMLEVDEKIKEVSRFKRRKRKTFLDDHVVPVIRGIDRALYVVDHHHFLVVCYHLGIRKVRYKVVEDLSRSKITYRAFWKWMNHTRNSYPFCQFGEGPRSEIYLPKDVRGLADDPYRSIAWFVRKAGAFENSDRNFAEFQWANFFRKKGLLNSHGLSGLERALVEAVTLAQSKAAKGLPGFGKLNLADQAKAKESVVKKARAAKRNKKHVQSL